MFYSKLDLGGTNIAEHLESKGAKATGIDASLLETYPEKMGIEGEERNKEPVIFASRHRSEKKIVCLTAHVPGNWSSNDAGGEKRKLSIAPAKLLKCAIVSLNETVKEKNLSEKWPVTLEVTHHGPSSDTPIIFMEIGSTEEEWRNKEAGEVMASAIIKTIEKCEQNNEYKIAFGIGGGHYAPEFTKVALETDIAVGHIVPKYKLDEFDVDMFRQGIERTKEKVELVLLDWKGMDSKQREKVQGFAKEMGLEVKDTKEVRKK